MPVDTQIENPTTAALRKSNVSRYIQLASLFRQRIETGEWEVGQKIPTVKELADECGVATMTIRQSLDILEEEGLIERYRAKGTFIRSRPHQDLWCNVKTEWSSLAQARDAVTIEVLEDLRNQQLPLHDAALGQPAASYRRLKRMHRRADEAFLIATVFVDERISHLITEKDFATSTTIGMITGLPGLTIGDGKQVVTIGSADLEASMLLDISIGDPVAKVQRVAVNANDEIVLMSFGIYRGDKLRLELDLRP